MWQSIVETAMGKECAAQGGRQRKFTHIVMIHVLVAIASNDSRANFSYTENLSHVGMHVSTCKSRAA